MSQSFFGNKKHFQIVLDDLLYVEALGNYTKLVLAYESITIREKLSSILSDLPATDFIQVHRSFLVSLKHIKSIQGNEITLLQHSIPIGKSYKTRLLETIKTFGQ